MIDFLKFFVVQSYFISNQCNKFGVCGLALSRAYGISEQIIDRIHLASAPRNLDGMADRTLHTARSRLMLLGNRRIENLGNTGQHFLVLHRDNNGIP